MNIEKRRGYLNGTMACIGANLRELALIEVEADESSFEKDDYDTGYAQAIAAKFRELREAK